MTTKGISHQNFEDPRLYSTLASKKQAKSKRGSTSLGELDNRTSDRLATLRPRRQQPTNSEMEESQHEDETATSTPTATSALSTNDLLQMMLSMQQSMNAFQLSMAEERAAEKKAQEARENRELALREKMLEIEQKRLEDMQATREQAKADQEAAQALAKSDQERLLKEQEEAKENRRKENEVAKKKEERLKAIPNTPAMTKVTDLIEYLALFETTQTRKEREKEEWAIHLLPLRNDKLRVVAMNMSPSERDNYQTLKAKLIESEETNLKNSAHSFWTLPKDKGMSIRDYGHKLYRLLKRFAGDPDPEVVLQKVLRERIIQILPKDARAFVRNRDPETVAKACCLAEQYFSNEESDLTAWP